MYILGGILATTVILVLQIFWRVLSGSSLIELYICVGAFFTGFIVCGVMTKAMIKFNKKATKFRIFICVLMAVGTFITVNYTEYKIDEKNLIHINWDYKVNYLDQRSFITYTKGKLDNKQIKYIVPKKGKTGWFDTRGIPNYIIFSIQFITVILGGLYACKYYGLDCYCDKCKRYYTKKTIFTVKESALCKISRRGEINVSDIEKFKKFIQTNELMEIKDKTSYTGILQYCDKCKKGKVIVKKFMPDGKEKKEIYTSEQIVDVDPQFVNAISPLSPKSYI